jgi:pyrroline-5-carboxylate reductase
MLQLQLIGGGRMGTALVTGLLSAGWAEPAEIVIVERLGSRRDELAVELPDVRVESEIVASVGAVLAVKPGDVADVATALGERGVDRVLSIAAGVTTTEIGSALGVKVPVVRAMPNTPALIGAGVAAIAAGATADDTDLEWARGILGAVGEVVVVSEEQLDAVTGLSGSGPAYVFLVAESLIEAGVHAGLPRDVAETLTNQTLLGSARLLVETAHDAPTHRANVTSPAGTTAAGIRELEERGVRAAFLAAVEAASTRSRELSGG